MATITFPFAEYGDGSVRVEVDLNDANRRVSKARCVNNSAYDAAFTVLSKGAVVYTKVAPAGATTEQNVAGWTLPQQPDYWNSITGQYEPDGIDMGGYTVQARWPA